MGKAAFSSRIIITALIMFITNMAPLVGFVMGEDERKIITQIIEDGYLVVMTLINIVGSVVIMYKRWGPQTPVTGVFQPASPKTTRELNLDQIRRNSGL